MEAHHDDVARRYAERDLSTLQEAIERTIRRRSVVQAGGHLGTFANHLALHFGAIYVFEPDPRLFVWMVRNMRYSTIRPCNAALGCERGPVRTVNARRDGNTSRLAHSGVTHTVYDPAGTVRVLRIDDLRLEDCDLIVLDVEGFELDALHGASRTIERCRPVIMVEVNESSTANGVSQDMIDAFFKARKYIPVQTIRSDQIWKPL